MEKNKSSNGLKAGLVIALALFLGTGIYTINLYKNSAKVEKDLTEQKQLVMDDLSNMAKQYDEAIAENEVANQDLIDARARIQGLIDSLKVSETNVKVLWSYKQKYISLQKEMDVLLTENEMLKAENSNLSTSLDSTRVSLQERIVFSDSLLVQNSALAEVVSDASVLTAVGLKGFGVIQRTSGKLIPTERASRTDKIRICYTVAKNKLVKAGDQELYIQVIDPKSKTLGLDNHIDLGSRRVNYSIISKFNYENANLNICEFVTSNGTDKFSKGRYIVNVFNYKDLVSTTEFILK